MSFKIGLELHGYIDVATKLFCDCPIDHDAQPNTTICPICTGQPGSKPMLPSKDAVHKAIQIGLLLDCTINESLLFQRKHYSWPDLPNGYQKTMSGDFAGPVGVNGKFKGIGIRECHLEEDPARWDPVSGKVDYNRSGYPLIEIVTEPDFTDLEQLRAWLDELVLALSYIKAIHRSAGVKGDVNISIFPKFERVEIKNINSFTAIVEAATFEIARQKQESSAGNAIPPQTRAWNDTTKQTVFMRSKESAADYRFIPEPDLPLIHVPANEVDALRASMPQTPEQKRVTLQKLGLSKDDANVLANDFDLISLYEQVKDVDALFAARWVRREVVRIANWHKVTVGDLGLRPDDLRDLLVLLKSKEITENVGMTIMEKLGDHARGHPGEPFNVRAYVTENALGSVADTSALKEHCSAVIAANPRAVEDYRNGEEKALNFLVGQVMKITRGAAKPDVLVPIFKTLLD